MSTDNVGDDRILVLEEVCDLRLWHSLENFACFFLSFKQFLQPEKSSGQAHVEDRDIPEDELHQNQDDHDFNAEYGIQYIFVIQS